MSAVLQSSEDVLPPTRRVVTEQRGIIEDIAGVKATAAELSKLGAKNAALRDLAGKLEPSLAAIDAGSAQLIDVGARWQAGKAAAFDLVASASQTLEAFVSSAQLVPPSVE